MSGRNTNARIWHEKGKNYDKKNRIPSLFSLPVCCFFILNLLLDIALDILTKHCSYSVCLKLLCKHNLCWCFFGRFKFHCQSKIVHLSLWWNRRGKKMCKNNIIYIWHWRRYFVVVYVFVRISFAYTAYVSFFQV